jgi:hypothetical protein
MHLLMYLPVKGMLNAKIRLYRYIYLLNAIKYDFIDAFTCKTDGFRCVPLFRRKINVSDEAFCLDLEIVECSNKISRWGHQMVSGISGLVTVGECNFILVDPLFGIYMQAILA